MINASSCQYALTASMLGTDKFATAIRHASCMGVLVGVGVGNAVAVAVGVGEFAGVGVGDPIGVGRLIGDGVLVGTAVGVADSTMQLPCSTM